MRLLVLGGVLLSTLANAAPPKPNGKDEMALLSELRTDSGSNVMIQQYAKQKKYEGDSYITFRCPANQGKCQAINIELTNTSIPQKKK